MKILEKLENQAREVLAGRGITYNLHTHWTAVAKLVAVAKAAKDFHGVIRHEQLGNYQEDFHHWLGDALKSLEASDD